MSTPANFNGARPVIDVNDTAMLLIDHQSGLFQTVGDMPMPELRARAAALAKMASLAGIPVITTASVPQGPNGPLIPEIHENAPHAKYIARKGEINAWDNPEFVAAVKATGRKTLIIAGTITSVCMAFPAIAAVADGYKVFAVYTLSRRAPSATRTPHHIVLLLTLGGQRGATIGSCVKTVKHIFFFLYRPLTQ